MNITEVQIVEPGDDRRSNLLAYASIVIDGMLVIRDLKIIQAEGDRVFVDFPSVAITGRCGNCGRKVECRVGHVPHYCSWCGFEQPPVNGRVNHTNVAHPINDACRRIVHNAVMTEYRRRKSAGAPVGRREDFK